MRDATVVIDGAYYNRTTGRRRPGDLARLLAGGVAGHYNHVEMIVVDSDPREWGGPESSWRQRWHDVLRSEGVRVDLVRMRPGQICRSQEGGDVKIALHVINAICENRSVILVTGDGDLSVAVEAAADVAKHDQRVILIGFDNSLAKKLRLLNGYKGRVTVDIRTDPRTMA